MNRYSPDIEGGVMDDHKGQYVRWDDVKALLLSIERAVIEGETRDDAAALITEALKP